MATYTYPGLISGPVGWLTLGGVALTTNFVCEIPARTFKVTSRTYQNILKQNKTYDLSYGEFVWDNLYDLSKRGVKEALPKTFASDIVIGNTLKELVFKPIKQAEDYSSNFLTTKICKLVTGGNPDLSDQKGIYNKAATCFTAAAAAGVVKKAIIYPCFV